MKLLSRYGISRPLISYWGEREKVKSEAVMGALREGRSVALVSDSGTPGISDPGSVLISKAVSEGFDVIPIPGPSALIAALSVSGLPTEKFTFMGFLPPKPAQRRKALEDISLEEGTLIFYEAPHRLIQALGDMLEVLGDRRAAVIKEITKAHETALRGVLSDILRLVEESTIAGEYVIVVSGRQRQAASVDEALAEVLALIKKGKGRKEAVNIVAGQYGLSKGGLYERSLKG